MTIRELILHLHEAILRERLSGDEQVLMPDICTTEEPKSIGDMECVSAVGVAVLADNERVLLLVNTTRAASITLRDAIARKP